MHVALLCSWLVSPTFWHDLMAQTPVRVIAAAGSVGIIVQFIKVAFPQWICGRRVILVNVATSVAAVLIGMDPAHFWTQTTLAQILSVAGLATGVHSTTKTLLGQPIGVPPNVKNPQPTMKSNNDPDPQPGGNFEK